MNILLFNRLKSRLENWLPDNDVDTYYFDTILGGDRDDAAATVTTYSSSSQQQQQIFVQNDDDGQEEAGLKQANKYKDNHPRITTTRGINISVRDILVEPQLVNKAGKSGNSQTSSDHRSSSDETSSYTSLDNEVQEVLSPHVLDLQS